MRIHEVVLPAADPAVPAAFHPDRYGSSVVRFEQGPDVCSHFAVNVAPDRFQEAVGWARGQATLIQEDVPFPDWRARAAYYFDPAGNLVELIARERAPGDELLIEVSEVGLPVADVAAAVDFFEAELGLPHFSGRTSARSATTTACSSWSRSGEPGCSRTGPPAMPRCGSRSRGRPRAS